MLGHHVGDESGNWDGLRDGLVAGHRHIFSLMHDGLVFDGLDWLGDVFDVMMRSWLLPSHDAVMAVADSGDELCVVLYGGEVAAGMMVLSGWVVAFQVVRLSHHRALMLGKVATGMVGQSMVAFLVMGLFYHVADHSGEVAAGMVFQSMVAFLVMGEHCGGNRAYQPGVIMGVGSL